MLLYLVVLAVEEGRRRKAVCGVVVWVEGEGEWGSGERRSAQCKQGGAVAGEEGHGGLGQLAAGNEKGHICRFVLW